MVTLMVRPAPLTDRAQQYTWRCCFCRHAETSP